MACFFFCLFTYWDKVQENTDYTDARFLTGGESQHKVQSGRKKPTQEGCYRDYTDTTDSGLWSPDWPVFFLTWVPALLDLHLLGIADRLQLD